jgi:phage replication-related protein YjqB (UPF0714/DUF867 family)
MPWTNHDAIHRHAFHAYEDFNRLRKLLGGRETELWHSMSHHLRHAVYRSGLDISDKRFTSIRRSQRFHQ